MAGREGGRSSMERQFLVQEECSSIAGGGIEVTDSPELFPGNIRDSDRRGGVSTAGQSEETSGF